MEIRRRTLLTAAILFGAMPAFARERHIPQPEASLWDPEIRPLMEGNAAGPNGNVYWRRYGDAGKTPVVLLHGGPAAGHRYLRPYAGLTTDRQVVLYDQSGCGRSDSPAELSRYTVALYVEELEALRAQLALPRMILIGHSWGGSLALAYALAHPDRVGGLVLAGSVAKWRDFQAAADIWLAQLGPSAVATVRHAEATQQYDSPAYGAVLQAYYRRHLCRLDPPPAWFREGGQAIGHNPVYQYLNGPSEFEFGGALRDLDFSRDLHRIRTPTLVTCGEFDEAPPWVGRRLAGLIPGAQLRTFEGLSHMSHVEDPLTVVGATSRFVRRLI
jgi:proline-specific peptidase